MKQQTFADIRLTREHPPKNNLRFGGTQVTFIAYFGRTGHRVCPLVGITALIYNERGRASRSALLNS